MEREHQQRRPLFVSDGNSQATSIPLPSNVRAAPEAMSTIPVVQPISPLDTFAGGGLRWIFSAPWHVDPERPSVALFTAPSHSRSISQPQPRAEDESTASSDGEQDAEHPDLLYVVSPDGKKHSLALRLETPTDLKDRKDFLAAVEEGSAAYDASMAADGNLEHPVDVMLPFFSRRSQDIDNLMYERRKRIFLFMIALDFVYSAMLLIVNFSLSGKSAEFLIRAFWIGSLLVDVIGFVAAMRNSSWAITAFIVFEALVICGFLVLVFSPLVLLRLIIFLLALQVRVSMIRIG